MKGVKKMTKSQTNSKSYQIKMDSKVHALLKKRAKQLDKMTIGEFVQNLMTALESRLENYRQRIGFEESSRNDELDARLIKFMILQDTMPLTPHEIDAKLDKIRQDFSINGYKPTLTIRDDDG